MLAFFIRVCYYIEAVVSGKHFRVWRSLVSRLNGVQEASSSNLDTRTKSWEFSLKTVKTPNFLFSCFWIAYLEKLRYYQSITNA